MEQNFNVPGSDMQNADAVDANTLVTEVANGFYVRTVDGNTLGLTRSIAMSGVQTEITVGDDTGIYDVSVYAEYPGARLSLSHLRPMDRLTVYADERGNVTHIFLTAFAVAELDPTDVPDEGLVIPIP